MPKKTQTPGLLPFGPSQQRATMIIKVGTRGPDPDWQDSDTIMVRTWNQTRRFHAEHLAHPKNMFGGVGVRRLLGETGRLAWLEKARQYRFERQNATEVKRVLLSDMTEEIFGPSQIDVESFVQRRLKHPTHQIFGNAGSEIWYGGKTTVDEPTLDTVWAEIESLTSELESTFNFFPIGTDDLIDHLVLTVDDMDDVDAQDMELPDTDETDPDNPITLKKRKWTFPWQAINGMTASRIADVQAAGVSVDVRDVKHPRSLYASIKA